MRLVALAIATVFGVGYAPFAPGTAGSLAALALWLVLPPTVAAYSAAILLIFALGAWSGAVAERHFQQRDPGPVVVDEVLGMTITLFMNPVGWGGAIAGFLFFRFFDVVKPYPARQLEHLHGGFGIMADDAMAAVYANLALRLVLAASYAIYN